MTKKEQHDILVEFKKSSAWTVLEKEMRDAIIQAALQLTEQGGNMTTDEIHFRRGAMWAAQKFLDLPSNLVSRLENDLLLDAAQQGKPITSKLNSDATASTLN
jgi:hypothetical protein